MLVEPAAIALANTRSSKSRDRIATLAEWRLWIDRSPGLQSAGHRIDLDGLTALRSIRDDLQGLLRSIVSGDRHDRVAAARVLELARQPSFELRWRAGRLALSVSRDADPSAALTRQFARAALDVLLTGPPLALCEGRDCLKLFIVSRPDRRWCDTTVCGNRARVRAHNRRHRQANSLETPTACRTHRS